VLNFLKKLVKSSGSSIRNTVPARTARRHTRLGLESLEDRSVPALLHNPIAPLATNYFMISGVPSSVAAGTNISVTVTEYSSHTGQPMNNTNAQVSLTFSDGGDSLPLGTIILHGSTGTTTVRPTVAETGGIFATIGSITNRATYVSGFARLTVNAAAASHFVVTAPTTVTVGDPFNMSIVAEDAYDNVVHTYNNTPRITASDGYPVSLSQITWSQGVGSATVTAQNPGTTKLTAAVGSSIFANRVTGNFKVVGTSGAVNVDAISSTSPNWSGYAVSDAGVSAVGATWVQPAVSGTGATASSMWVGIDGYQGSTVEQIGTAASTSNGNPSYVAWYELYGDQANGKQGPDYNQVNIPTSSINIQPGDTISAEVSLVAGTTATFLFQMTDEPANGGAVESFSIQQTMQYVTPKLSTAEWIVENPNFNFNTNTAAQPISDFGTATFTGAWATIGKTTGPINSFANIVALNLSSNQGNDTTTNLPSIARTLGYHEPSAGADSSSFSITYLNSGESIFSGITTSHLSDKQLLASLINSANAQHRLNNDDNGAAMSAFYLGASDSGLWSDSAD
jgi:hypothetical protein